MFADISDSTKLYDQKGDTEAEQEINTCLSTLTVLVQRNSGKVVKTIGDEIMCRFPNVDSALQAAITIQTQIEEKTFENPSHLQVRIGIHHGPVIEKKGDLFGDVINVASRMVSIAQAKQIIVTDQVAKSISPNLDVRMRQYDNVKVKGKEEEQLIYEIIWEDDDQITKIPNATIIRNSSNQLILEYQGVGQEVVATMTEFTIGRGDKSDLIVLSDFASRTHAAIEYHRGNFILKDQSRNGTYVEDQDGKSFYLRREEIRLIGSGSISLGEPVKDNDSNLIQYHCT